MQIHRSAEMITINKSGQMSCRLEAYANQRFHHLGSTNPHKAMHVVERAQTTSLLWLSNQNKINIFCEKQNANLIPAFYFGGGRGRGGEERRQSYLSKMSAYFKERRVESSSGRILFRKGLIDNLGRSSSPCDRAQLLCDVASSLCGAAAAVVSDPLPHHSFKWLLSTPMALTLRWLHIYPEPLRLQYLAPVPISPSLDFFQQCFSWSY